MANVQVRNVSPVTHQRLVQLADRKGMSLSEFLRLELDRLAALPTWEEMSRRIALNGRVKLDVDVAELIREDRDSR